MGRQHVIAMAGLVACTLVAASGTAVAAPERQPPTASTGSTGFVGSAATEITARLGAARSLPPDFYGVNFDYGGASSYAADGKIDSQLAALNPGTLRYPGGSQANFFQWHLGYPVNPPSGPRCATSPTRHFYRFTLADLRKAYRATGATPVFDLNVMTSTRACQISMLRRARQLGLPVKYVELGNEEYLSGDDYPAYVRNAATYGRAVAGYVKALHHDFPRVHVGAVGAARNNTPRARTWNHNMLEAARTARGLPDAVILHMYTSDNKALTRSKLAGLFVDPYLKVSGVNRVIRALPTARPVWITEYNLRRYHPANRNPAQTTYAEALIVAEMDLLLASHVGKAQFVDFWSSFGANASNSYAGSAARPVLTPGGLALSLVDQAARGVRRSWPIVFTGAPNLGKSSKPALIGERFSTTAEVLVNLSSRTLTIKAGAAVPAHAPYEQVTYSGSPAAQVAAASSLTKSHGTTSSTVRMAPYSILVIR